MLCSIFKADIRQPIGGDFAFSPKMARYWTGMAWENSTRQYGIDIFMTTSRSWNIGSELWAKILYDFIFAYETSEDKEEVVEALKPLYFARTASFYRQTMDMTHQESEEKILEQAKQFQKCRGYLFNKFGSYMRN